MDCLLQIHLSENIYELLSNVLEPSELTLSSLAALDDFELQYRANLTKEEVRILKSQLANIILQNKITTGSHLPISERLKTGCKILDNFFNNGLPAFGVTEFVGESGVGKTQLCLQLALFVQLPRSLGGFEKSAVFICTEDVFPIKRLTEIYECMREAYINLLDETDLRDNILIQHIGDYTQLIKLINTKLKELLYYREIGLIVIDSIAGAFRSCNNISYVLRAQVLTRVVEKLSKISQQHNAVIVFTNQVTSNPLSGKSEPCLGLTWSNLISRRFIISRNYPSDVRVITASIIDYQLEQQEANFTIKRFGLAPP